MKAGLTPLPFVQVGMKLLSKPSTVKWLVTAIYEEGDTTFIHLTRDANGETLNVHYESSLVRASFVLAEDFDPESFHNEPG